MAVNMGCVDYQKEIDALKRENDRLERHLQEIVAVYQETLAKLDVAEAARKRNWEQLAEQKQYTELEQHRVLESQAETAETREQLAAAQRELDAAKKFIQGYRSCTLRDQIADLSKQLASSVPLDKHLKELEGEQ